MVAPRCLPSGSPSSLSGKKEDEVAFSQSQCSRQVRRCGAAARVEVAGNAVFLEYRHRPDRLRDNWTRGSKILIAFGPVAEAAKGGQSSPTFDLCVGFAVLAITWVGYSKQGPDRKVRIWAALGVSAICAVFIGAGLSLH